MSYIYQHTDSKIIKLGFGSMAGYREKKPDKKDYYAIPDDAIKADNYFSETIFKMDFTNWEQSRIGYIKEPEWKIGDVVKRNYSDSSSGYMVGNLIAIKGDTLICFNSPYDEGILKKDATHFHPGQQVESFKYVREEANCPECNAKLIYSTSSEIWDCPQCLESEGKTVSYFSLELVISWQEVEEPEEEELKSGVILLEVITKK